MKMNSGHKMVNGCTMGSRAMKRKMGINIKDVHKMIEDAFQFIETEMNSNKLPDSIILQKDDCFKQFKELEKIYTDIKSKQPITTINSNSKTSNAFNVPKMNVKVVIKNGI